MENAPPPVIVTDNAAIVHIPRSLWSVLPFVEPKENVLTSFVVRSAAHDKKAVAITSSGLGDARFSLSRAADLKTLVAPEYFLHAEVDQEGKRIFMQLPDDAVPSFGTTSEGKIVVLPTDSKPLEVSLKVDRSSPPLLTSIDWFVAILVPTGLTALVGLFVARLTAKSSARSSELTGFRKFKDENYEKLHTFFDGFYPTAYEQQDDADFARELREALQEQKILAEIARKERQKLEAAFQKKHRRIIQKHLKRLFPEWEHVIEPKRSG